MMKLAILFISSLAYAAVGDHAPAIPSTYLASHPRLGAPDATYLNTVWAARANATRATGGSKYIFDAANSWAGPAAESYIDCRYLLIAHMADALNSGPNHAAYLASIQAMSKQAFEDGTAITGASWSAGTATITIGVFTVNFSPGDHISVSGMNPSGYNTKNAVLTAVGSTTVSYAVVSDPGSFVSGGAMGNLGSNALAGSVCEALAYDWEFGNLSSGTKATFLADLQDWSAQWESGLASVAPSPYNDVAYIDGGLLGMPLAIAQYPDGGAVSLGHMRYAMDYYFNMAIPVWKQLWGPTGAGTTATATSGSGCWHETWEYTNAASNFGLMQHMGPTLLSWARATNNYPGLFTTTYPWFQNVPYCQMYQARPDMTLERLNGSANGGWLSPEYDGRTGANFGSLELIAAAYNDANLRGWSRLLDWGNVTPYGIEPAAFPFLTPDSSALTANTTNFGRSGMSKVREFDTFGAFFRTGWGEDDTFASLRCSDNYWSHDIQDQGAFTIYSRGGLAIRPSTYQAGSASPHFFLYGKQAISQNVPLVLDGTVNSGNDYYSAEQVTIFHNDGTNSTVAMPNDGGQRRVGSGWNLGSSLAQIMQSPYDQAMWNRAREIYHACTFVGFAVNNGYSYAALDLTSAYNDLYSRNPHTASSRYDQANTTNRTARVQRAVRHFVWIPRGTAAYVVIYDQITSTSSGMQKSWLLHTIEQPTISSNHFTATRNRTATLHPVNFCSSTYGFGLSHCGTGTYDYAGQLDGWMTLPTVASSATVCKLGGSGHEFDVGATTDSSCTVTYGTNYNECMQSQCTGDPSLGIGTTVGFVVPDQTIGGSEPGAWRIEEKPGSAATANWFLNVMLAQGVATGITITVAPSTSTSGTNYVTTWTDSLAGQTCAYTLTLPIAGVGGTLTAAGAGCATVIN